MTRENNCLNVPAKRMLASTLMSQDRPTVAKNVLIVAFATVSALMSPFQKAAMANCLDEVCKYIDLVLIGIF
jgi:hypothetical protein